MSMEITNAIKVEYLGEVFWAVNYVNAANEGSCRIEYKEPSTLNIIDFVTFEKSSTKDDQYFEAMHQIDNEKNRIKNKEFSRDSDIQGEVDALNAKKELVIVEQILPDNPEVKKVAQIIFNKSKDIFEVRLSESRMAVVPLVFKDRYKLAKQRYTLMAKIRKLFEKELSKT